MISDKLLMGLGMKHLFFAVLMAWAGSSWALTGTDLKDICDRDSSTFRLACLMYIAGVSDGLNLAPSFYKSYEDKTDEIICFPGGVKQSLRRTIVESYLKDHPDILEFPAEVLIYMALKEVWSCPDQNDETDRSRPPADPPPG